MTFLIIPLQICYLKAIIIFSHSVVVSVLLVYSHTEADVNSQSLLEANVSTEVCLTVLDTLSTFIMGFKVVAVQTICQTV